MLGSDGCQSLWVGLTESADGADEGLEATADDEQVARTIGAGAQRVGHLGRGEAELAGPDRVQALADPHGQLAIEDVPALAILAMDVQRRLAVRRREHLDECEVAGVSARRVDAGAAAEEVEVVGHLRTPWHRVSSDLEFIPPNRSYVNVKEAD